MSEPLASISIPTDKGVPEEPYFCPLCGVSYNVNQNQTCYCHPRLDQ